MILYILRHGLAEETSATGDDGSRKLTARGREKMHDAAVRMRTHGLKFDAILSSPLTRAAETAELVSEAYAGTIAPQVLPELGTGVSPAEVVAALKPFARMKNVMIVGHEPQLSGLAALLITGTNDGARIELKKGAVIALDLPARAERGGAKLLWLLTSRQLRKLRK